MKTHTKIYLNAFDIDPSEVILCEVCASVAVDIHHINARGMGGNPSGDKDRIENLQAVCRDCHIKYGDNVNFKVKLLITHTGALKVRGVNYCSEYLLDQIIKYS